MRDFGLRELRPLRPVFFGHKRRFTNLATAHATLQSGPFLKEILRQVADS
jgi:hypothetical protein